MFRRYADLFLEYVTLVDFSTRSIEALTARPNKFENFLATKKLRSIKKITYLHLVEFTADFRAPSIHNTKSRVWMLRKFYHFLTLHNHVPSNLGMNLPYPKIEKIVPQFLTAGELKRLIRYFSERATDTRIKKSCHHHAAGLSGDQNQCPYIRQC